MSVSAHVDAESPRGFWNITIVFSRPAGLPAMQGHEVDAELIDDRGVTMRVVERPSGPLVELGGGLGNSVNAQFQFQGSGMASAELVVIYRGERTHFRIVPDEGGKD